MEVQIPETRWTRGIMLAVGWLYFGCVVRGGDGFLLSSADIRDEGYLAGERNGVILRYSRGGHCAWINQSSEAR